MRRIILPPLPPIAMTPIQARRQLRGRTQWCFRAAALTLALHGRAVAAQLDTHAHGAKSGEGAPRLGTITFPTSANARAQAAFVRGIAYLHSFHYQQAAKAFQAAERADSAFALPYWFEAFTHSHLMWSEEDVPAGRKVLARLNATPAARLARAATPREREYGAAFEAFFADTTPDVRTRAFADSMRSMTWRYPADLEVAAFTSLAIMLAIDQRAFPADSMDVHAKQMVDLAEGVFKANPNHPGAAHYLIHISDFDPAFSTRALPAARAYARIAPDASHALHMPSHVFLRLGLWDDGASSNERSWAASRREMVRDKLTGADIDSHSLDFLSYAYLEAGRWRAARAIIDTARRVIGKADLSDPSHFGTRYAISSLTFVNAAETGSWRDVVFAPATTGPPQSQRQWFTMMVADYQRHVIEAMRGDTAALAAGVADFRARSDAAHAAMPGLEFAASELEGLLARARGDSARAMERLTHAGIFEDRIPIAGPPPFVSAHELVAAAYSKAGHPDSAAAHFERLLTDQPKRSAALLGLARARVALGERDAAVKAYSQLLANWHGADADIPNLAEARGGATGKFTAALGADGGLADYIRFAVLPLPEQMRAGATVMRPDSTGRPVVVRRGTNGIACMRFVPGEGAWDARCYEETMFQVVLRMRELFRSGVAPHAVGPRVDAEMKAGTLKLPTHPAVGYRALGGPDAYNPATGVATPRLDIWQSIHVPFATARQLGFPDESTVSDTQVTGVPFVMASGTGWAHVMIKHPAPASKP